MTTEPVTLSDVARVAGVSPATASRALATAPGGRTVRAELAQRVRAAAQELGYTINANASAVARGTSQTVGLVVSNIADPFAAAVAAGVIEACAAHGLIVTIASGQSDAELERRHVDALARARARAVILVDTRLVDDENSRWAADTFRAVPAAGGRIAVVGRGAAGLDAVEVPNRAGGAHLARTLCALGYRSFAALCGPEWLATSEDRIAGFADGLAQHGLALRPENIVTTQFDRDGGYVAMRELLDRGAELDCVFAANDMMAVGAMAALREQGLRVGADIGLAGFDDIALLRDIEPPLTTVRLPLEMLGHEAVRIALSGGMQEPGSAAGTAIRAEVVVRASTPSRI